MLHDERCELARTQFAANCHCAARAYLKDASDEERAAYAKATGLHLEQL